MIQRSVCTLHTMEKRVIISRRKIFRDINSNKFFNINVAFKKFFSKKCQRISVIRWHAIFFVKSMESKVFFSKTVNFTNFCDKLMSFNVNVICKLIIFTKKLLYKNYISLIYNILKKKKY